MLQASTGGERPMGKKTRHFHILRMIESTTIESQQDLLNSLAKEGLDISQSTLSKDLKELGIIKVRGKEGRFRFLQTKEREIFHVGVMLRKELQDFLTDTVPVGNFVVLKTASGNASGTAKCLDDIGWPEIIGTLGGDDTVLIITKSPEEAGSVVAKLQDVLASK
jgi:transcriptional regulator of arginine metabolism